MNPQSVIIYRSRSEAEIDRLIWSGDGTLGIILISLFVWVFVFYGIFNLYSSKISKNRFKIPSYMTFVCGVVAIPVTYGLMKILGKLIMYI